MRLLEKEKFQNGETCFLLKEPPLQFLAVQHESGEVVAGSQPTSACYTPAGGTGTPLDGLELRSMDTVYKIEGNRLLSLFEQVLEGRVSWIRVGGGESQIEPAITRIVIDQP